MNVMGNIERARGPVFWLLAAQAALTGVTGVTLLIVPEAIPASFGLSLTPDAHLLCYFYGASELSLAFMSIAAMWLSSAEFFLRICCTYFAVAHVTEGAAGLYAVMQGLPAAILANSGVHFVVATLFVVAALSTRKAEHHSSALRRVS